MEKKYFPCNFLVPTVIGASVSNKPLHVQIETRILEIMYPTYSKVKNIFYPQKALPETPSRQVIPPPGIDILNLQAGEWVQVRSMDEISPTLDRNQKYKGLFFMPEMEKFCGGKFKVFKRAEIIKLESTGEIRKLKSPSIFLEGVYCDGERHEGCDRACFHFWREAWLKRIQKTQ